MAAILSLGEKITFGKKGSASKYMGEGWAPPDSDARTWTGANVAQIAFRSMFSNAELKLEFTAGPMLGQKKLDQELNVYINGIWVGYYRAGVAQDYAINFSGDILRNRGDNVVSFVMPGATSPFDLGMGDDRRLLGFWFEALKVSAR